MREQTTTIKIHNVKLRLITDFCDYHNYVQMHFNKVILPDFTEDCEIEVRLNLQKDLWGNNPPNLKEERFNDFEKIGASTLFKDNNLVKLEKIRGRKFRLEFLLEGKRLLVSASCHYKVMKNIFSRFSKKTGDSLFTDFSYFLIYYPIFWYLENFHDLHPLHAACVSVEGNTCIFFGLEAIGKTALSLSLLEHKDSVFVSDNLILYNSGHIYPCYQPIKLRPQEKLIPLNKLNQIKEFKEKVFYELAIDYDNLELGPGFFILPRFAQKPYLKEITDRQEFAQLVYYTNFLVCEVENYQHTAHLLGVLFPKVDLDKLRFAGLSNLINSSKCYFLGIGRGEKINETVERLRALMHNKTR